MSKTWIAFLIVGLTLAAQAQLPDAPSASRPASAQKESERHTGLYLGTGNAGDKFEPMTIKRKFGFAAINSFGPLVYPEVALVAGINQASNQQPSWGQGGEGFA